MLLGLIYLSMPLAFSERVRDRSLERFFFLLLLFVVVVVLLMKEGMCLDQVGKVLILILYPFLLYLFR